MLYHTGWYKGVHFMFTVFCQITDDDDDDDDDSYHGLSSKILKQ